MSRLQGRLARLEQDEQARQELVAGQELLQINVVFGNDGYDALPPGTVIYHITFAPGGSWVEVKGEGQAWLKETSP